MPLDPSRWAFQRRLRSWFANAPRESVRYHFGSGSVSKLVSLVIQSAQVFLIARTLGQTGFGEFVLIWTICTMITSVGTAWASAYQNQMVDDFKANRLNLSVQAATVSVALGTALAFGLVCLSATFLGGAISGLRLLNETSLTQKVMLLLSTEAASINAVQLAVYAAEGKSASLAQNQNLGKILALAFVIPFSVTSLKSSPVDMLSGVQFFGAIPALWVLFPYFRSRATSAPPDREKRAQKTKLFWRFGALNLLSSSHRVLELNLVAAYAGTPAAATYSLAQKLFTPVSSVFLMGARNLWPYLRRSQPEYLQRFAQSVKKLRMIGATGSLILLGVFLVFEPVILKLVKFSYPFQNIALLVVTIQCFYLIWISFSFNSFAALGKEKLTLWVVAGQTVVLLLVWILAATSHSSLVVYSGLILDYLLAIIVCRHLEKKLFLPGNVITKEPRIASALNS